MPVGPLTEGPPRKPTAFDLNMRRGPNAGTEWAGPNEEKNPGRIIDSGDTSSPNRFTEYNDGSVKGKPNGRLIDEILAERGFDCAVCKLHFAHQDTFSAHCAIDPRGNGKQMKCEVDKRLFEEKNAEEKAHMQDPNAVALAVAEALKPTLLSIVGAFEKVNETLDRLSRGEQPKKPKKEGKKRGNPRLVRGAAPARGAEPPGSVESTEGPLADPAPESPSAE